MQTNLIAKNNINFTSNKLVNEIIKSPAAKEMADKMVTLRRLGQEKQESMPLAEFVEMMKDAVKLPL